MDKKIIIEPHRGINGLLLGSNQGVVLRILGSPDYIENGDTPELGYQHDDVTWTYCDYGFSLTFYEDDNYLLGSICVTSDSAELFNCRFVGLEEKKFLHKIQKNCPSIFLEDDLPDVNARNYRIKELDLDFWVYEGVLYSITVIPEYDITGDIPIWPKVD